MKLSDYHEVELQLMLQRGNPIIVRGVKIPQLTLGEIVDMGFLKFQFCLELVTADIAKVLKDHFGDVPPEIFSDESFKSLTPMDLYLSHPDSRVRNVYIESWCILLKDDTLRPEEVDNENWQLVGGKKDKEYVINKENISDIISAIMLIYCIDKDEDKMKFDPKNKKAMELWLQMQAAKEKMKQALAKKGGDDGIDLPTIISTVCSVHPSLNYTNIFNLTLYMLYDSFNRLIIKDQYDREFFIALKTGEFPKEHFTKKINKS